MMNASRLDRCVCGDYRHQHRDSAGPCLLNGLGHGGSGDCGKFVRAADLHSPQSEPSTTPGGGFPEGWDRDETKTGIFRDHSCSRCNSGALPCIKGNGRERDCDTLHARND